MLDYVLLAVGFVFLIYGASILVDGASSLAYKFKISNLVIGLTVVAFGTSAPELFVNLFASLNGTPDIAIGNIVGSNIANIFLILGISALVYPIAVGKSTVWKEIPLSLFASVLLIIMANDSVINSLRFNAISRSDGLVLISFFAIFLYYTYSIAGKGGDKVEEPKLTLQNKHSAFYVMLIFFGLIGLALGGHFIVDSATRIAANFGLSQSFIALTVVALGTSLPELATSVVAAYKKNLSIAVGNVIGSCIFNVFLILGVSSIISPLPFKPELNFDLSVAALASFILFLSMFLGKKHILTRWQGALFLLIYINYMIIIYSRG